MLYHQFRKKLYIIHSKSGISIINFAEIVYHPLEEWHIIKAQALYIIKVLALHIIKAQALHIIKALALHIIKAQALHIIKSQVIHAKA